MTQEVQGLIRAGDAWREYEARLPWGSRPSFYNALQRHEIPSVRFGTAIYVPRWALEALANGDIEAIKGGGVSLGMRDYEHG